MSPARIEFTHSAREHAERVQRWWLEHRAAAPDLFEAELAAALQQLADFPRIGPPYLHPRARGIRRLLMPRCRYHLYYRLDADASVVTVVAIWYSQRGVGPPLT
jgi:plasmid stabilization system protein ParE